MTYTEAWNLTKSTTYEQAQEEEWGDEWLAADDLITVADYDYTHGITPSVEV